MHFCIDLYDFLPEVKVKVKSTVGQVEWHAHFRTGQVAKNLNIKPCCCLANRQNL